MENNIKEEFISTLSHEIRTPLTSIKGFSQTMLDNWDKIEENKKKEFLNIILNQSQRLINLVENVLNVAKIDSNNDNLILSKVDINNTLLNCINIIKISRKDFEFIFKKSKNELYSLSDVDKTQQIFLNILDNAVKYSNASTKILIRTYTNNDFNVVSVKNWGSYIKQSDRAKIFEKFTRIDSYLNSKAQGSGLGLYIAGNLIKKMQGKIEVLSDEKKQETEFLIYLPVYEIEKATKI